MKSMTADDLAHLGSAIQSLEHPSLASRLASLFGKPVELIGTTLPPSATQIVSRATAAGLEMALNIALRTIRKIPRAGSAILHKALATASGAAGGAFGLTALPLELPVSTIIILRSVADIARSEGEDLSDPEAALACLQVFAFGGRPRSDDASESGYFAVRAVLAKSVSEAARYIAQHGALKEGSPILVKFVTQVATRFGVVVTQKAAAQALPIIGALGGAAVNYAFVEHFQDIARAHFTVRRLERIYGQDLVRREYDRLARRD
jgi:hypothetical protein